MSSGYKARDAVLLEAARRGVQEAEDALTRNRLSALAWLISTGALDVKLAFRIDPVTKRICRGIYHEKIGIFSDAHANHVAFTGSQNETEGGLVENFESIDVYCSWLDPQGRIARKLKAFDDLWTDQTRGLSVVSFNEVSREVLDRFKTTVAPDSDPEESNLVIASESKGKGVPHIPPAITLRDYQAQAVRSWLKHNGRGILEMATGTGKTITALAAIAKLSDGIGLQAVIVVCPFKHLVKQWAKECSRFGLQPLLAFEARTKWTDEMAIGLSALARDMEAFLCVITTNTTFISETFQQRLKYFPPKTCFIADEVHNLGATRFSAVLPENIKLRLGLSATPERWFDVAGTERLKEYFGPVLEPRLGIREAIQLKALTPYRYFPIFIELTESERDEYLELSSKIARLYTAVKGDVDDPGLNALLLRRARLLGTAANKLVELRRFGLQSRNRSHMLFYCGDGSVESDIDETIKRQVDEVTRVLGVEIGLQVGKYTAETELDERDTLRADLDSRRLQALVAIRCLDEGIDIPSVRTAVILASSTNPRQFVQRRGRVLRPYAGKEFAEIYDMIVVPPKEAFVTESERSLLRKELVRFAEFADIALNAGEAREKVLELQKKFDLTDI
jgi:DNA phosphorothioation system restriction enzyme